MSNERDIREDEARTANEVSGRAAAVIQAGSIAGGVHLHSLPPVEIRVPHELPPDVFAFTGRVEQLAEMDLLLASVEEALPTAAMMISAISGTAGVGKTAFATHWAHRVSDRFPDGQLYLDLHGYSRKRPVSPKEALAGLLRSLGVPNKDIPFKLDERASRFRSIAAGRRMLIVLDNARSSEQVRPLLPGTSSCLVLVTSRNALPGLVSRDGARRVSLGLLPHAQAVALLRMLIGPRVDAERGSADALIRHCARLPLALRIAADLAVMNPDASLTELVGDLTSEQGRLDVLETGDDPSTAVRAVLSWSYRNLEPTEARAFRLLGLHPGRDFESLSAAALIDMTPTATRRLLSSLVRSYLLERTRAGRYQMHDLLREYAARLASQEESDVAQEDAKRRLFDFFVRAASLAMDILLPQEQDRRPRLTDSGRSTVNLADGGEATRWLEAERSTFLAVAAQTKDTSLAIYSTLLSTTLFRYFDVQGYFDEAARLHAFAVTAGRRQNDPIAIGQALHNLGTVYQRLGRYRAARDHLKRAIAIISPTGQPKAEALALADLGFVEMLLGQLDDALEYESQALRLFEDEEDRGGQGQALNNMGLVLDRLHRHEESVEHTQLALALFRQTGDKPRQRLALNDIGVGLQHQGNYAEALDYHREALVLAQATRDRALEAAALNGLGNATRLVDGAASVLDLHEQALTIAQEISDLYEQAQAHEGLANAHTALENTTEARKRWELALSIYVEIGAPEADHVRDRLANRAERRTPTARRGCCDSSAIDAGC